MKVNKYAHEYLRSTLTFTYTECEHCKYRTQFACIRCGYCWTCHYKKEQSERKLLEEFLTIRGLSPISYHFRDEAIPETYRLGHKNRSEKVIVVDVFGKASEPICNYLRCHHKFSIHGEESHICKCRHPQNRILGVSRSI
jgi:hypothetical protein